LKNPIYSLNGKDYNKTDIICGNDYELVKLGDICEGINGYAFKTSDYKKEGIPLITITHIKNGKINFNDNNFIEEDEKYSKFLIKKNDILLTLTGKKPNICSFAINTDNKKMYLNQRCAILRNYKIEKNYLFSTLNSILLKYINDNATDGTNQDNVSLKYILDLQIPIPKDKEKITEWVDKISKPYDEMNSKKNKILELEDKIKEKIDYIVSNEECDEVELGSLCDIKLGTRITKKDNLDGNIPVYGGGDITFYTNKHNREKYTLIISRYAMSKTCVRLIPNVFYLNDSGMSISSKNLKYKIYLNYYLLSHNIQEYIYNNCSSGSIQRNINMPLFEKIKIKIPKDEKLIDNLEPRFKEIEKLQTETKEAEELYNKYIKELSKEAIISDDVEITKSEDKIIIEDTKSIKSEDKIKESSDDEQIIEEKKDKKIKKKTKKSKSEESSSDDKKIKKKVKSKSKKDE